MKLIDRIIDKAVSSSTAVVETAVNTIELGKQIMRLGEAVAKIALVVNQHAALLRELQEFHRQLINGIEKNDLDTLTARPESQTSEDDKKRMN